MSFYWGWPQICQNKGDGAAFGRPIPDFGGLVLVFRSGLGRVRLLRLGLERHSGTIVRRGGVIICKSRPSVSFILIWVFGRRAQGRDAEGEKSRPRRRLGFVRSHCSHPDAVGGLRSAKPVFASICIQRNRSRNVLLSEPESLRKSMRPFRHLLLFVAVSGTTVMAQATRGTANSPAKPTTASTRVLPAIKCIDADSIVACKSFKQLVDARDKGVLLSLTGGEASQRRHFAYVCLRPKDDVFSIVEFDEPLPEEYRPYSPPDIAKDPMIALREQEAFEYDEGKPAVSLIDAQKQWYEDHDDYSLYQFGRVYLDSWQNGILSDMVHDLGKWRRPSPQSHVRSDGDVSFEGAHEWLVRFNEANGNRLAVVDEPEYAHISVGESLIFVRYGFRNQKNDLTDYTLSIQRSTGRFTESFEAPNVETFQNSGTCMTFKY